MLTIRKAVVADVPFLRAMICELAEYEKAPNEVQVAEADLVRDGFGEAPKFRALIAEWDGRPAGCALFFGCYSTWRGRGIFLEDLFVRPDFRKRGIGKALLAQVAKTAVEESCVLLLWEVLDWNTPAIEMYKSLGAEFLDEWRRVLLPEEALRRLAGKAS